MTLKMSIKEVCNAFRKAIDNETKIESGELVFEFYRSNNECLDLTSAILPQSSDELSFATFLSSDFTDQPVVLVSKLRHGSVSEDNNNQSESTPASIKSNARPLCTLTGLKLRIRLGKDASDVWGSPLKCSIPSEDESVSSLCLDTSQTSLETKKQKPKHFGIPLNTARKILSQYNCDAASATHHPLLVLCDGRDRHTTALMGVKPFQVSKETRTAKGFKMVTLMVDRKGEVDVSKRKINIGGGLMQTCQAVYQVNADGQKPWATVAVEIKWKGPNRLLETPPVEATTAVKASVQSGSMMSCMSFYQELQFLERIITALTSGQVEWISLSNDNPLPLTTAMKELIDTLQEDGTLGSGAAQEDQEAESWTFATALKTFGIPERKDFDFTDRLWKVMLDCMSTADLVSSLHLVFRAIGQGHLRPFVDRRNQTTVAQIVRESFMGRFSAPSLTGLQPFQFVAEMGVEKLRRDYIHILVSQSLATPACLKPFTAPDQDLHLKLDNLAKLHAVLEMVALLGASLRLPSDTLSMVVQRMLSYYSQHPADPRHVFSFPMKTSEVRHVISSIPPSVWCVETSSQEQTENITESSLHCLSLTQPLLHVQADSSNKGDNSVELRPEKDGLSDYCLVQRRETVVIM